VTPLFWSNALALVVGTVAGGAFLARYVIKVPKWYREEHRAHVVAFSGVVWVFYALYAARYLSDPAHAPGVDPTGFNVVRGVLFWVLTGVVVWRCVIFERGLWRQRRSALRAAARDVP